MALCDVEQLAANLTARRVHEDHENVLAESSNTDQGQDVLVVKNRTNGTSDGHHTMLSGSTIISHTEQNCTDALGIKRAKLLQTMCVTSMMMVIVSICAILTGTLALTTYASKSGYIICGGVISGGMALLFSICPFCMYHEGKKKKRGNNFGILYMCCLHSMLIGFSFVLCGILVALGISGIWGTVECIRAKQGTHLFSNICLESTDAQLTISILTLITTSVILILAITIMCIFCCNTKAFGYKTERQRQADYYEDIRREARDEAMREVAELNALRNIHSGPSTSNRRPETGNYGKRRPADPSAPPLEGVWSEEPPPSYDEVIRKGVR